MQLTRYTDYGLRVLIYLALLPQGEQASINQISDTYGISRNNVNKIVHQLGKQGIIYTKRGKGGGLILAKSAADINIGAMVKLLENTLTMVECGNPACRILPSCKLKNILQEATDAFMSSLHQYTLLDLIKNDRHSLINLLALDVKEIK